MCDLYQLQPVGDGWIFQDLSTDYGPLATNLWKQCFKMYELTEIMRQKDDNVFASLLNRLREGNQTAEDVALLKQCTTADTSDLLPMIHLYTTNKLVNDFNSSLFEKVFSEKVVVPALDSVLGDFSSEVKDKIKQAIKSDPSKTAGLHNPLNMGIGLRYELVANLGVEDGLTNGAGCFLRKIEYKMLLTTRPSVIWVEFDHESIGKQQRLKYRAYFSSGICQLWTPLFDIKRKFSVTRNAVAVRIQFPLRPAGAKTVHKAQGETLTDVVIHLGHAKRDHIHYVALSRARNLTGVHILELNEHKISVSDAVTFEMRRLRKEARIKLCYDPVYMIPDSKFKLLFHNARSLHAHFNDVISDQNFVSAYILGFAESRLVNADQTSDYCLPGFMPYRNDQQQDPHSRCRPAHGLLTLVKDTCPVLNVEHFNSVALEFTAVTLVHGNTPLQIVFIYRAGFCSLGVFKTLIKKELCPHLENTVPCVIMGDFNYDVMSGNHSSFQTFMKSAFNCLQVSMEPTTDYGSCLDLIFSNIEGISTSYIECPWSDHKAIAVAIN